MKNRRKTKNFLSPRPLVKMAAYGALGLGLQGARAETTITFGGFTGNNTQISTLPGYGDNVNANSADYTVALGPTGVVGTPDITLDWAGLQWDTYTAWDGRGNVAQ